MAKRVFIDVVSDDFPGQMALCHIAVNFFPKKDCEQLEGGLYESIRDKNGKGMNTVFEENLSTELPSATDVESKLYNEAFKSLSKCSALARKKDTRLAVLLNVSSKLLTNSVVCGLSVIQGVLKELANRRQIRSFECITIFVNSGKTKSAIESIIASAAIMLDVTKQGSGVALYHEKQARNLHNEINHPELKHKRNIPERLLKRIFLKKTRVQQNGESVYNVARSSSVDMSENTDQDMKMVDEYLRRVAARKNINSPSGSEEVSEDEEEEDLAQHEVLFQVMLKENCSHADVHFLNQISFGSRTEIWGKKLCMTQHKGLLAKTGTFEQYTFEQNGKPVKRWFANHTLTNSKKRNHTKKEILKTVYDVGTLLNQTVSTLNHNCIQVGTTLLENANISVTENAAAIVAGILLHLMDPNVFVNITNYVLVVNTEEEMMEVSKFLAASAVSSGVDSGFSAVISPEDCRKLHNFLVKPFKNLESVPKPRGKKFAEHTKPLEQIPRRGEKLTLACHQMETPRTESGESSPLDNRDFEPMEVDEYEMSEKETGEEEDAEDLAVHRVRLMVTLSTTLPGYAYYFNQLSYNEHIDHLAEQVCTEQYHGQVIESGCVRQHKFDVNGNPVRRWYANRTVEPISVSKKGRTQCAYKGGQDSMEDIARIEGHNIHVGSTLLLNANISLIDNVSAVIAGMLTKLRNPEVFVNIHTVMFMVETFEEIAQINDFFESLATSKCNLDVDTVEQDYFLNSPEQCRLLHNVLVKKMKSDLTKLVKPKGDEWILHTKPFDQIPRKGDNLMRCQDVYTSQEALYNDPRLQYMFPAVDNTALSPTATDHVQDDDSRLPHIPAAVDNTALSPTSDSHNRAFPTTPYSAKRSARSMRKSRRSTAQKAHQDDRATIRITEDMWILPGIQSSLKGYDDETKCPHCQALRYQVEKRSSCCQNGKVLLDEWRLPPRLIFDLLNGTHKKSKQFKDNIVTYCTLLGFASIQRQDMRPEPHGVQPVKNIGQMYSLSSSLYPLDPKKPGFANLYVLDAQTAKERRAEITAGMKHHPNIDQELLAELAEVISKYNCFAFAYKSFDEVIQEKRKQGVPEGNIYMRLLDRYDIPKDHPTHPGCLNIPRVGDAINVIFDSRTDEVFKVPDYDSFPRDLKDRQKRMQAMALNNVPVPKGLPICQKWRRRDEGRGGAPIPAWSPIGEPMAYVLLSPYGDFLFNPKRAKQSAKGSNNRDHEKSDTESIRNLLADATNYPPDNRSQLPRATGNQFDATRTNAGKTVEFRTKTVDLQSEDDPINANEPDNELDELLRLTQEDSAVDDRNIMPQYGFVDENGEILPLRKKTSSKKQMAPVRLVKKGAKLRFDDPNFSDMSEDEDQASPARSSHEHSPDCMHHTPPHNANGIESPTASQVSSNISPPRTRSDSEEMMDVDYSSDSDNGEKDEQHFTAEQLDKKSASRRESLAYRLHPRLWNVMHDFHPLISSRKLGQMYVIDQVMRMLDDQCGYIRKKRTVKLSNVKSRVAEYLGRAATRRNINIGTMTTMPATFQGSPRWYRELYEKAIALMNKIGKPDLFITFTGNAKWKEIEENLMKSTCWCDNTALVCQVFWKKFNEFLNDILGQKNKQSGKRPMKGIFGKVRGFVYSVEFQKRGMPHVHMLITLEDKLDSPEKVDAVIKGELPVVLSTMTDDEKERILHLRELVKHLMMHRPCLGRKDYCRKNVPSHWKQCQKRFPKPFVPVTSITDDGYATHMRRNAFDGGDDDNEWIVPYNPQLIEKYNCHINVELCASVHSAKYIFKYIFKGVDKVLMELIEGMDSQNLQHISINRHIIHPKGVKLSPEVLRYLEEEAKKTLAQHGIAPKDSSGNRVVVYDESLLWKEMRLLTATEATWKALELPLHGSSHYVEPLYVHEKDKEQMLIDEDADVNAVRQQISTLKSKMTSYFEIMRENPMMNFTYEEMPLHFRFVKNKWIERRYNKDNTIGHIKAVQPRFLQLFALRELAKVVKGATSFEDYLKDDNGDIHPNFAECARARRLLDGESEWTRAMNDSVSINMPSMVRRTFSQILVFGCPKQPRELWESFKEHMYDRWNMPDDQLMARALFHIGSYLRLHNKKLEDYGLPALDIPALKRSRSRPLDNEAEELTFSVEDSERLAKEMEDTLNDDQKNAVERVTDCINGGGGNSFFLEGSGGTGKTFVYKYLFHKMNSLGKKVEMVAHTGIAATLLINGSTAHGKYRIPLNLDEDEFSNIDIDRATKRVSELRNLDAIVWDEATMSDWRMFRCVDILLQKVRDSNLPFGGVCVIAGGDWKQLLPVSSGASPIGAKNLALKESPVWKHFETITLKKNMRAVQDPEFAAYLEEVGHGTLTSQNEFHRVEIPEKMIRPSLDTVIDELFPRENMQDVNKIKGVCLLTVRNVDALAYNDKIMARLDGVPRLYKSMDRPVEEKSLVAIPPETFHNQTPNGLPPHVLKLKVGCMVMLLRNLNVKRGLCNGTKLTVLKMMDDLLLCETIPVHKEDSPQQVQLFRMPMVSTTRPGEFQFQRMQFPIRLAYCLTINKSQGQTLDKIGIALKTPVFSHGHMYVALSRAKNSDSVLFHSEKAANDKAAGVRHFTQNIVYRDMIRSAPARTQLNVVPSIPAITAVTQVPKIVKAPKTISGDLLLLNRGTDCFLNVIVQMSRAVTEIRNTAFPRWNVTWKEFSELCNSVGPHSVSKLRKLIGMDDKKQHDAHEAFSQLVWALGEKEAVHISTKTRTFVECIQCGEERITDDRATGVLELSASTDTAESITSMFNEYTRWTDDESRSCENCETPSSPGQTPHRTRNQYDFDSNQALCVALPLLSANGDKRKFQLTKQETIFDMGGCKWEIVGAAVHRGQSAYNGHYVCYIKQQKGWKLYNDNEKPIIVGSINRNFLDVACVMLKKHIPQ